MISYADSTTRYSEFDRASDLWLLNLSRLSVQIEKDESHFPQCMSTLNSLNNELITNLAQIGK